VTVPRDRDGWRELAILPVNVAPRAPTICASWHVTSSTKSCRPRTHGAVDVEADTRRRGAS
jgi:hypothetical protein